VSMAMQESNTHGSGTDSGKANRSWGGIPVRERYGLVLALILVGYLLAGFETSRLAMVVNSLIWIALLLTTLSAPGLPDGLRRWGLAATVVVLITAIPLGLVSSGLASGWRLLVLALAQLAAMLAILNRITRHNTVTLQTVMGGIAAYALIAFVMAAVFHGTDLLTDETFLNGAVAAGDYTYFSFVTLTTVGYGDITAASDLAKRLVVLEAFVGQVFLITLVARLVSLWGPPGAD
jgi:voltage-gated potassium channel Kch